MWTDRAKKELRWLYKRCPAWGGRLARGQAEDVAGNIRAYIDEGYIRPGEGGYYLTQRGIDYAFEN